MVLIVRFGGASITETARQLGCSESKVKRMVAEYKKSGFEEFMRSKYGGNHRSLSEEEEKEILKRFEKLAAEGHIVTGQDIKKAFDERIGKDTGRGYIYMLLKRHGWRKVMPRAKHPKKANEEAIEASKNLHANHGNQLSRLCSKNSVNATSVTKSEISRFRSRRPLPPDPYCSAPTQPPPLAAAWPWQVIGKNAKLNRRRDTFVSEISEFRHRRRD